MMIYIESEDYFPEELRGKYGSGEYAEEENEMNESEMNNEIELVEKRAMIYLPENSVEVEVICKVYEDGELKTVAKTLKMSEIQASFQDAEVNYISDDDKFVVTEKGLRWLEDLEPKEND